MGKKKLTMNPVRVEAKRRKAEKKKAEQNKKLEDAENKYWGERDKNEAAKEKRMAKKEEAKRRERAKRIEKAELKRKEEVKDGKIQIKGKKTVNEYKEDRERARLRKEDFQRKLNEKHNGGGEKVRFSILGSVDSCERGKGEWEVI